MLEQACTYSRSDVFSPRKTSIIFCGAWVSKMMASVRIAGGVAVARLTQLVIVRVFFFSKYKYFGVIKVHGP